jgi:hypothetical protein
MTILPFAVYIFKQAIQTAYKFHFFYYLVNFFTIRPTIWTVPISTQAFLKDKIETQLQFLKRLFNFLSLMQKKANIRLTNVVRSRIERLSPSQKKIGQFFPDFLSCFYTFRVSGNRYSRGRREAGRKGNIIDILSRKHSTPHHVGHGIKKS